jgi:hypothetical protein
MQMQWIGIFSSWKEENENMGEVAKRISLIRCMCEIGETIGDLSFQPSAQCFLYNTHNWNIDCPGGMDVSATRCKPSELLVSYTGNWTLEDRSNASMRLFRAAAPIMVHEGVDAALRLLMRCSAQGLVTSNESVYWAVRLLSAAKAEMRQLGDESWLHRFAGLQAGWADTEVPDSFEEEYANDDVLKEFINAGFRICQEIIEDTREAADYDEWIRGQHVINLFCGAFVALAKHGPLKLPHAGMTFLDYVEEIYCDAMGSRLTQENNLSPNYVTATLLSKILRHQIGDDAESRFWQDRVALPYALRDHFDFNESTLHQLPVPWRGHSVAAAPAWCIRSSKANKHEMMMTMQKSTTGTPTVDEWHQTLLKGMDLHKQGRCVEALAVAQALETDLPYNWLIKLELAIYLDESGRTEEALEKIMAAILIEPTHSDLWVSFGVILRRLGRHEDCIVVRALGKMIAQAETSQSDGGDEE